MVAYKLTNRAEVDIEEIYEYSILNFGLTTASQYLDKLYTRFDVLAQNPGLGINYTDIAPGLRRYEHTSHSIYYTRLDTGDVLIVRVLGAHQDPAQHF